MEKQKTIKKEASLSGIGLHTGNKVNINFRPAGVDSGINFIRKGLPDQKNILAVVENLLPISRNPRRTSIGKGSIEIHTIEHLMAVLSGLSIDNISIEIDNNEIPGLDGSGKEFSDILTKAGIVEQPKARDYYQIKEAIYVEEEGGASIIAIPSSEFRVSYTLSYNHSQINVQFLDLIINSASFEKELVNSRTFCLEEEAGDLKRQGLGQGANYENTLVVGEKGIVKNKLRYEDEYVRHKILDLIGDLYLLGSPLKGHIIGVRSGHSLNIKLLKKIKEQKERFILGGVCTAGGHVGEGELDVEEIKKILPHRYPFLFVDKILSLEKGKRAVGLKNVTKDDYYFKGHFPGKPVMPGVLIIEAMAQVGGVMMLSLEQNRNKLAYFLAANNVKFRKTVLPGDKLVLDVEIGKLKSKTGLVHGKAMVDSKVVAEADLMFAIAES